MENPSVVPQQALLKAHLVVRDSSRRGWRRENPTGTVACRS